MDITKVSDQILSWVGAVEELGANPLFQEFCRMPQLGETCVAEEIAKFQRCYSQFLNLISVEEGIGDHLKEFGELVAGAVQSSLEILSSVPFSAFLASRIEEARNSGTRAALKLLVDTLQLWKALQGIDLGLLDELSAIGVERK